MGKKKDADTEFQGKAHAGLGTRAAAQRESDRANEPIKVTIDAEGVKRIREFGDKHPNGYTPPVINAGDFERAHKAGAFDTSADPWEGKKRLDAGPKALRVPFTEDEIRERRIELEKRLAQTPHLRDQFNAAKDAAKAAKDRLSAHVADSEGYSAITKQGWQYQEVECITVLAGSHAVTYRTDSGEEISRREATSADLQDSIPGV